MMANSPNAANTAETLATAMIARTGVPRSGWTAASARGIAPALAIPYMTRDAAVSASSVVLVVVMTAIAATTVAPRPPSTWAMTSASGRGDAAHAPAAGSLTDATGQCTVSAL